MITHRGGAGRTGELAYWDEDTKRFGRGSGRNGILSYSYLAAGP